MWNTGAVGLLILGAAVSLVACTEDPEQLPRDAAVVNDASVGNCPAEIAIDPNFIDVRSNAIDKLPTFGGKGYAMWVKPDSPNWDELQIGENLSNGNEMDWYWASLPAGVPLCPNNALGDAARAASCGADPSVFTVGEVGDPPARQPEIISHFWDSHFIYADFDFMGELRSSVQGAENLKKCRLACTQFYECHGSGGAPIPGDFGIVTELQHVTSAMPYRTDGSISKINLAGQVF